MSATITIWNNRLGFTTLPAPKELAPQTRAALQSKLRIGPGESITLPRDIWALIARRPGVWSMVENGEISSRKREVMRRRPPTDLTKLDRKALGPAKGNASDFVHGLEPDDVLLRDVERAQRERQNVRGHDAIALSALATAPTGDYRALAASLSKHGVNLDQLAAAMKAPPVGARGVSDMPPSPPPVPLDEPKSKDEPKAKDEGKGGKTDGKADEPKGGKPKDATGK